MEQFKAFLFKLNEIGIPLPLLRDPIKKSPSVSLTMLIITFLLTFIGIIGKMGNVIDINVDQAMNLFSVCSILYFGRSIAGKVNNIVDSTKKE